MLTTSDINKFIREVKGKKIRWSTWTTSYLIPNGSILPDPNGKGNPIIVGIDDTGKANINCQVQKGFLEIENGYWIALEPLNKEGVGVMKSLKEYFEKHKEVIFTVGIVVLIDHFFLNGAFRERLKGLVEKLLTRTEAKLLTKE